MNSPTNEELISIIFTNENTGWTGSYHGKKIYKSTNGGLSWTEQQFQAYDFITAIYFINNSNGWLSLYEGLLKNTSKIMKTTNEGVNWIEVLSFEGKLQDIFFINPITGWTIGLGGRILKTTNGGYNWFKQISNTENGLNSVFFINANTGFAVGYHATILITTDGGNNWINRSIAGSNIELHDVKLSDNNNGFIVGSGGTILKTSDGGNNWINVISGTNHLLKSISLINNNGWIVGSFRTILKTTNGGGIVNIYEPTIMPVQFNLHQNYPNPFNPVTNISFSVAKSQLVKVIVYDINGKLVEVLLDKFINSGNYNIMFDGSKLSSGVYFYKIQTEGFSDTKKMILAK
jgi:photosystem II stability/assembly factor-like uncharacterized protein